MPDYRNKATGARLREDAYRRRVTDGDLVVAEWEPVPDAAQPQQLELPEPPPEKPRPPQPKKPRRKKR